MPPRRPSAMVKADAIVQFISWPPKRHQLPQCLSILRPPSLVLHLLTLVVLKALMVILLFVSGFVVLILFSFLRSPSPSLLILIFILMFALSFSFSFSKWHGSLVVSWASVRLSWLACTRMANTARTPTRPMNACKVRKRARIRKKRRRIRKPRGFTSTPAAAYFATEKAKTREVLELKKVD